MNLVIVCDNDPINLLMTNAIAKPLSAKYKVYLDCPDTFAPLFVNNPAFQGAGERDKKYDVSAVVNPHLRHYDADVYFGSNYDSDHYYNARNKSEHSSRNLFQMFFSMMGVTWNGEGYDFHYYPRNRQKKDTVGIAIRDSELKDYITTNIVIRDTKRWDIPIKMNVLKQADEINRCSHIITDDETCVHVALALRKNVEYVVTNEPNYSTEMFGSGKIHLFDCLRKQEGLNAQVTNTPTS